jgi:hypothetical protein
LRQAAEARARAEAEARQQAEIAARQAEDARRRADEERKRLAAEDARRKEDEQRKAEEARKRATAERTPAPRTFEGFDAQGGDIGSDRRNVDRSDCEAACRSEPRCVAYSYDSWNRYCHVKHTVGQLVRNARATLVVRDGATAITFSTAEVTFERWSGHDFPTGKLIEERHTLGIDACEGHCRDNAQCVAFTYVRTPGRCRLFSSTGVYEKNSEADSRAKRQLAP